MKLRLKGEKKSLLEKIAFLGKEHFDTKKKCDELKSECQVLKEELGLRKEESHPRIMLFFPLSIFYDSQ